MNMEKSTVDAGRLRPNGFVIRYIDDEIDETQLDKDLNELPQFYLDEALTTLVDNLGNGESLLPIQNKLLKVIEKLLSKGANPAAGLSASSSLFLINYFKNKIGSVSYEIAANPIISNVFDDNFDTVKVLLKTADKKTKEFVLIFFARMKNSEDDPPGYNLKILKKLLKLGLRPTKNVLLAAQNAHNSNVVNFLKTQKLEKTSYSLDDFEEDEDENSEDEDSEEEDDD
jgi:hypothetical protein